MSAEWLIDSTAVLQIFLAVILGGAVGLERELHARPAGLRTHVVVCVAATMLMIASEFFVPSGTPGILDLNRMAAGIITGIGFLGAGAILREENVVRGLTTAGCVWFVAGLGIVIGKGYFALAIWTTVVVVVILTIFRYMEGWLNVENFRNITLRLNSGQYESVQKQCRDLFRSGNARIEQKSFRFNNSERQVEVTYRLKVRRKLDAENMLIDLSRVDGVIEVRG